MDEYTVKYNYVFQPYAPDSDLYPNIYAVSGPDVIGAEVPKLNGISKSTAYLHARRLNEVHSRVEFESDYFKDQYNKLFAMVDEALEALQEVNNPHEMMSAIFRNLKEVKDFIERETIIQPNVYMFIHARILNLYSELEHVNAFLNDLNRRSNEVNKT